MKRWYGDTASYFSGCSLFGRSHQANHSASPVKRYLRWYFEIRLSNLKYLYYLYLYYRIIILVCFCIIVYMYYYITIDIYYLP